MNRRAMLRPASLVLACCIAVSGCANDNRGADQSSSLAPLAGAKIGGDFALVDKTGKPVRFHDFAGKYRMIYFGYTFCPDACPADVQTLMRGYAGFAKERPAAAARVQPIFVTIDPERDTPGVVGEFAAAFSPKLLGLTGSAEQVAEAAKMFAVYYKKGDATPDGGYLMDHSRAAYLLGPKGEPIALLPVDQTADAVAKELEKWTS